MWIQQRPRGLNHEESKALANTLLSMAELLDDLRNTGHVNKSNARVSVRQLIKTHPVTRSLGVSEATLAKLVSTIQ
jgi:hypothetical protein